MSIANIVLNPIVAGLAVLPIDRGATNPPISFGGDPINNSGTGVYGDFASISHSVAGSFVMALSATALTVANTVSLVGALDLRMVNDVCIIQRAGVPVDGTSGTGAGIAGPGSMCVDRTNANLYINGNTKASPTWKLVTRAA